MSHLKQNCLLLRLFRLIVNNILNNLIVDWCEMLNSFRGLVYQNLYFSCFLLRYFYLFLSFHFFGSFFINLQLILLASFGVFLNNFYLFTLYIILNSIFFFNLIRKLVIQIINELRRTIVIDSSFRLVRVYLFIL